MRRKIDEVAPSYVAERLDNGFEYKEGSDRYGENTLKLVSILYQMGAVKTGQIRIVFATFNVENACFGDFVIDMRCAKIEVLKLDSLRLAITITTIHGEQYCGFMVADFDDFEAYGSLDEFVWMTRPLSKNITLLANKTTQPADDMEITNVNRGGVKSTLIPNGWRLAGKEVVA